jgi:hypothetical protein
MNKNKNKSDALIDLLKEGKKALKDNNGISISHIKNIYGKTNYKNITWEFVNKYLNENFSELPKLKKESVTTSSGKSNENEKANEEDRYNLNSEGYFRLLQYESLQEARKWSRIAIYIAAASIITSPFISVLVTKQFLNKPTEVKIISSLELDTIKTKIDLHVIKVDSSLVKANEIDFRLSTFDTIKWQVQHD